MPARSTTPESAVLRSVLRTLGLFGVPAFRFNSGVLPNPAGRPVRFGVVGGSDVVGLLPFASGRMIAVETKAPGREGTLTPAQHAFLSAVRDAGGVALVISDAARLAAILSELRDDPGKVYELPPRPAEKARR